MFNCWSSCSDSSKIKSRKYTNPPSKIVLNTYYYQELIKKSKDRNPYDLL